MPLCLYRTDLNYRNLYWHSATRDSWFLHVVTHVAAEPVAGDAKKGNEWLEPVADEQYNAL